jgi:hypothetical protein
MEASALHQLACSKGLAIHAASLTSDPPALPQLAAPLLDAGPAHLTSLLPPLDGSGGGDGGLAVMGADVSHGSVGGRVRMEPSIGEPPPCCTHCMATHPAWPQPLGSSVFNLLLNAARVCIGSCSCHNTCRQAGSCDPARLHCSFH